MAPVRAGEAKLANSQAGSMCSLRAIAATLGS
jgi:hypothetical protein